jgi:hypothetical protein
MPDMTTIETTADDAQDQSEPQASSDASRWRPPSHDSRRAAAIEAAYILEAVRK